ncbi:MAG: ABC transporter substrate-binding protein [Chromatiaceae bacterium]
MPSTPVRRCRNWIRYGTAVVILTLAATALPPTPDASAADRIRVAVLKFGTANWGLDVVKRRGLDQAEGFDLELIEFASPQATMVALQGGRADIAISDWIWVARQREEGRPFTFVPYSTATGALVVPAGSPITSLADLRGKRLGVAGGPLDKSWLLLRALSLRQQGQDLAAEVDPVFAAPPLLNEQIKEGRIDAVLNYWHYAARLVASGMTTLLEVKDAGNALGIRTEVPMIGYVFDERWASQHRDALLAFFRATRAAQALLLESDAEWTEVRPQMGAPDQATFEALRDGYRNGIPRHWGEAERADAARLFDVLREIGGNRLVDSASKIPEGTFWSEIID